MKANYKPPKNNSEIKHEVTLGSLYDINQQLMQQEPLLSNELKIEKITQLQKWFAKNISEQYFMLLCNDQKDYTLFNLESKHFSPVQMYETAAQDVIECLENRGSILAITLEDNNAWELWIRNSEGNFAYYLLPYRKGVLEY